MKPEDLDLTPEFARLWQTLHASHEFSEDADLLLRRAFVRFALSDALLEQARAKGFATRDGRGLLAASRDSEMVAMKLLAQVGLAKAEVEAARRPGRPSGDGWSSMRKQGPQRHPVTGVLLRRPASVP